MGIVSNAAFATPRRLYAGQVSTYASWTQAYIAPAADANVPSDCATAIIKDILITNCSIAGNSSVVSCSIAILSGPSTVVSYLFYNIPVGNWESKSFTGLNIALLPGQIIGVEASGVAVNVMITGVEVQ